jgi:hypothetical protein
MRRIVAFSEKQNAAATWKKTFSEGFHPLLAFADRPEISGGEGLAGLLRAGNAGSNTAADHVTVLDMALESLPEHARPRPGDPGLAAGTGPLRFRGGDAPVRRRLPQAGRGVLVRVPGR